jgi:hypothetical protein
MTDDILARLDAPTAEAWRPTEPGDLLVGRVLAVGHRDGGYGDYPIVTVQPERATVAGAEQTTSAPLAVHGLGKVLSERFDELAVRPGGRIAVRYDGEKRNKKGETYKAWSVAYDPPAPGADLVARLDPVGDLEPF